MNTMTGLMPKFRRRLAVLLVACLGLASLVRCLPSQRVFAGAASSGAAPAPAPARQLRYDVEPDYWLAEEGVGHFSEWSKATKRMFIDDVRADRANEWIVVMGNEGGGESLFPLCLLLAS